MLGLTTTKVGSVCLEAYILISAEPGMIWKVAEAALKIRGVKMAHASDWTV